jgi:hypothetical protein
MTPLDLFYTYLLILGISCSISLVKFKRLDNASKVISVLFTCAFITELSALFLAKFIKVKNPAYHIYSILELFLTTVYFIKVIRVSNAKHYILTAAILSPLIGLINMHYQHIRTINSYMLIFESFTFICMALYALYRILVDENVINVFSYSHFWIWALFLFYWSGSFFYWAFLISIVHLKSSLGYWVSIWQVAINIILYSGVGVILFLYKKNASF